MWFTCKTCKVWQTSLEISMEDRKDQLEHKAQHIIAAESGASCASTAYIVMPKLKHVFTATMSTEASTASCTLALLPLSTATTCCGDCSL